MMLFSSRLSIFMVLPLAASSAAWPVAPMAAEVCLPDWGRAGEIVRSENLITIEELTQEVLPGGGGQILKSTLCRRDGDYIYRFVVRDNAGKLRNTMVPARRAGRPVDSDASGE